MTRRVPLPSETQVRAKLAQIRSSDEHKNATVSGLAKQLGLANATFWRHFPQVAQEVADARRLSTAASKTLRQTDIKSADAEIALRTENARLRMQVDLAVSHIQQLTLDNRTLRDQLESRTGIVHLPKR